jgi:hypothetical protein
MALAPGSKPRGPRPLPISLRLWRKVKITTPKDCWLWAGGTNGNGYGVIGRGGRALGQTYVHRVAWELEHGPIPDGLEIDHLCHVRLCVNPGHLAVVTHAENNRRSPTVSTMHANQTHCVRGHPYDEANTYRPPGAPQSRRCRICDAERESRRTRDYRRPTCRHGHPYPAECPTDSKGRRMCPVCGRGPRH